MTNETDNTNRERRSRAKSSLFAAGEPMLWLTGGSLVLAVLMVLGLLLLVLVAGLSTFRVRPIIHFRMANGDVYMGEETRQEVYERPESGGPPTAIPRRLVRTGNFRLTHNHFKWLDAPQIVEETRPEWGTVVERLEWGRFYGFPRAFAVLQPIPDSLKFSPYEERAAYLAEQAARFEPRHGGELRVHARVDGDATKDVFLPPSDLPDSAQLLGLAEYFGGAASAWQGYERFHKPVRNRWRQRRRLEKFDTGEVNEIQEHGRLKVREAEMHLHDVEVASGLDSDAYTQAAEGLEAAQKAFEKDKQWAQAEFLRIREEIQAIDRENARHVLVMETSG